jgi:hypothetical protein
MKNNKYLGTINIDEVPTFVYNHIKKFKWYKLSCFISKNKYGHLMLDELRLQKLKK